MEENRIRLMEKLDRSFVEHLRRIQEAGGKVCPAELTAVYGYLKGARLRNCEVCALLSYPDPLEMALTCWKRNVNGNVFDLCVLLARVEADEVHPVLIVGVRLPASWQASSRKRREMLMGSQQILYGGFSRMDSASFGMTCGKCSP